MVSCSVGRWGSDHFLVLGAEGIRHQGASLRGDGDNDREE